VIRGPPRGHVVVAALFSFLVALVAMKVQRCSTSALPPSPATQASVKPAFPTPPAANAAPLVVPAPSAQPDPLCGCVAAVGCNRACRRADRAPAVSSPNHVRACQDGRRFSARAVPGATGKLRTPPRASRSPEAHRRRPIPGRPPAASDVEFRPFTHGGTTSPVLPEAVSHATGHWMQIRPDQIDPDAAK